MKQPDTTQEASLSLFEDAIPLFQVLADVNRQRIIVEIARHERLNVNQIDEKIELSRPAISHHLKLLRQAGIVSSEKIGTENFYFLTLEDAVGLLKALTRAIEDECIL
ncbi:ArsR/SmtB family transcription factor [Exiguobacterium sp. USCH10]|uniref:ArsR/SmtB family transcription factor n=1 Tax=Exiguobacterium sp. USCH10 TaxID=3024839 RepID=UPI0030A14800